MGSITRRQLFAGLAIVFVSLAATLGLIAASGDPLSTTDTGARFDPARGDVFEPTTFVPNTSPDKAIDIANGYLNEYYHWDAERLELEPRYTVGLFTGAYEITQEPVEKRKVAVVVYKGLPSQYLGYCTGEFNTEGTTYTLVLDDATGEFIAGSVTSRSPC